MKIKITLFFLLLVSFVVAQATAEAIDTASTDSIVLLYDTLPEISFFNPQNIQNHSSKIASYQTNSNSYKTLLLLLLIFCFAWFVAWYKDIFKAAYKMLYDFNYGHQYLRTKKNTNLIPLLLISGVFVLFSAIFIQQNIFTHSKFTYVLTAVVIVVLLDLISNYIFLFFAPATVLQLVQNNYLIFHIIALSVLVALYALANTDMHSMKNIANWLFFTMLLIMVVFRLFTTSYLLIAEKVKVYSLHFFIYLCTFKIMPLIILVSILLK